MLRLTKQTPAEKIAAQLATFSTRRAELETANKALETERASILQTQGRAVADGDTATANRQRARLREISDEIDSNRAGIAQIDADGAELETALKDATAREAVTIHAKATADHEKAAAAARAAISQWFKSEGKKHLHAITAALEAREAADAQHKAIAGHGVPGEGFRRNAVMELLWEVEAFEAGEYDKPREQVLASPAQVEAAARVAEALKSQPAAPSGEQRHRTRESLRDTTSRGWGGKPLIQL